MGPNAEATANHYQTAMKEVHKQLARPSMQRGVFTIARRTPTEIVRSKLSTAEIQHRAVSHLSDDMLTNVPASDESSYSLFQGFQASFPEMTDEGKKHRRRVSRGRKLLEDSRSTGQTTPSTLAGIKKEKAAMMHEFELLGVRKGMASSEIREIDNKIANLHGMRKIILERLAGLEQEEALLEHDSTLLVCLEAMLICSNRRRGPAGRGAGSCRRGRRGCAQHADARGGRLGGGQRRRRVHVPVRVREAAWIDE